MLFFRSRGKHFVVICKAAASPADVRVFLGRVARTQGPLSYPDDFTCGSLFLTPLWWISFFCLCDRLPSLGRCTFWVVLVRAARSPPDVTFLSEGAARTQFHWSSLCAGFSFLPARFSFVRMQGKLLLHLFSTPRRSVSFRPLWGETTTAQGASCDYFSFNRSTIEGK